ncbi:hypothetical protein PQX77_002356 [Marasmius sp. AFHP31]|nr:hypothetical protein PQX77_002356 [Marasmius sp. AFHP31]
MYQRSRTPPSLKNANPKPSLVIQPFPDAEPPRGTVPPHPPGTDREALKQYADFMLEFNSKHADSLISWLERRKQHDVEERRRVADEEAKWVEAERRREQELSAWREKEARKKDKKSSANRIEGSQEVRSDAGGPRLNGKHVGPSHRPPATDGDPSNTPEGSKGKGKEVEAKESDSSEPPCSACKARGSECKVQGPNRACSGCATKKVRCSLKSAQAPIDHPPSIDHPPIDDPPPNDGANDVQDIRDLVHGFQRWSTSVTTTLDRTNRLLEQVATRVEQVATSVEQVATSVEQVALSVEEYGPHQAKSTTLLNAILAQLQANSTLGSSKRKTGDSPAVSTGPLLKKAKLLKSSDHREWSPEDDVAVGTPGPASRKKR